MASTYDRFCYSPETTKCKIARSASSCTDRDVSWVFITAIILGTTAAIVSREVLLGMKNEVFILKKYNLVYMYKYQTENRKNTFYQEKT